MREANPRFRERGIRLVLIVQSRPDELLKNCGAEVECVADPDQVTHRAMGLGRATLGSLFFNADLRRRRKEAARQGFRQDWKRTFAPESDKWLLPGAALVERGGRILWRYRGEHTGDLPSAEELFAVASEHCVPVRS